MNVIIDTGCANLSSLQFAIQRLGYTVQISDDKDVIERADKVFLPGVGTAKHAMNNLRAKELDQLIPALTQPVLGVCLGMQLLTEASSEGRDGQSVSCLGIIPTSVQSLRTDEAQLRVPHMGWNTFVSIEDSPLFEGIDLNDYLYYVHSYCVPVGSCTLAQCNYNAYNLPQVNGGKGVTFSSAIGKDNFYGVQFHPERSGKVGSRLLKNFLEMTV